MERGLLLFVDGPVGGLEVRVLEQLTPVPTEALDVLVVGLLQAALEAPVHGPVSGKEGTSFYFEIFHSMSELLFEVLNYLDSVDCLSSKFW